MGTMVVPVSIGPAPVVAGDRIPQLATTDKLTLQRYAEFFAAHLRNASTRSAYHYATTAFLFWCQDRGIERLAAIGPIHVAAYIEELKQERSVPTVKQHLAAIRSLFDYLVTGQVIPFNPALSVRGPRYSTNKARHRPSRLKRHANCWMPVISPR